MDMRLVCRSHAGDDVELSLGVFSSSIMTSSSSPSGEFYKLSICSTTSSTSEGSSRNSLIFYSLVVLRHYSLLS